MRPFLNLLRNHYLDMTQYKSGLRSMQQTVCINAPCDRVPVNATYVCHREFIDLAKVANGEDTTVTSQFVTEGAYLTTA